MNIYHKSSSVALQLQSNDKQTWMIDQDYPDRRKPSGGNSCAPNFLISQMDCTQFARKKK